MKKIDSSRFTSLRAEEEQLTLINVSVSLIRMPIPVVEGGRPRKEDTLPPNRRLTAMGRFKGATRNGFCFYPRASVFALARRVKRLPSRGRGRSCVSGAADGAARPRTAGGGGPARSSFSPTPVPPLIFCELGVGRPAANPPRQVLAYRRASRANPCFTRGRLPKSRGDTRHLLAGLTRRVSARRRPWRLRGVWGGRA